MLSTLKITTKVILIILLLQLVGYYALAERFLPAVIANHRRALIIEEADKVYFASSNMLSNVQVAKVTSILKRTFPEVVYERNDQPIDFDRIVCSFSFRWQIPLPFFAVVNYGNVYQQEKGGGSYAETFEARYVWLLAFWWETSHRNLGQS